MTETRNQGEAGDGCPHGLTFQVNGACTLCTKAEPAPERITEEQCTGNSVVSAKPSSIATRPIAESVAPVSAATPAMESPWREHIERVKYLLEWMPNCSIGSSGYERRKRVEESLQIVAELLEQRKATER